MKKNFKKGEIITCINNYNLTIGKQYKVIKAYKESGRFHVQINGNYNLSCPLSDRFITKKLERTNKLKNIINII